PRSNRRSPERRYRDLIYSTKSIPSRQDQWRTSSEDGRDAATRPPRLGYVTEPISLTGGGPHEHDRREPDRDPVLPDRGPRREDRRLASAHRGLALAHQGARHRSIAGRAADDDPDACRLLGEPVRLRPSRGSAQRTAAVQNGDRRGRDPFHPRQVSA